MDAPPKPDTAVNTGDQRNVSNEIEIELVVQCGVERIVRCTKKQSIAIRSCANDAFRRQIAARPHFVFNDELLAEALGQ